MKHTQCLFHTNIQQHKHIHIWSQSGQHTVTLSQTTCHISLQTHTWHTATGIIAHKLLTHERVKVVGVYEGLAVQPGEGAGFHVHAGNLCSAAVPRVGARRHGQQIKLVMQWERFTGQHFYHHYLQEQEMPHGWFAVGFNLQINYHVEWSPPYMRNGNYNCMDCWIVGAKTLNVHADGYSQRIKPASLRL